MNNGQNIKQSNNSLNVVDSLSTFYLFCLSFSFFFLSFFNSSPVCLPWPVYCRLDLQLLISHIISDIMVNISQYC